MVSAKGLEPMTPSTSRIPDASFIAFYCLVLFCIIVESPYFMSFFEGVLFF